MREPRRVAFLLVCVATVAVLLAAPPASAGPTGGALPPELVQIVRVTERYGIPADAEMVAANVTAVGAEEPGFLTVFPCDETAPTTSNVNYQTDQVAPNLVFSRVAPDGTICIATRAVTDVLVDVVGYVPAGSALTPLPTPVRAVDTRGPEGSAPTRPAGSVLEIPVAGRYGLAPDAALVVFNATAIAGGSPGYLTAYPCGTLPDTSSVNYQPGQIVPNLVTSRLSAAGTLCIFTLAPADVIVDIAAFATAGIEPLPTPVRVVDTRLSGSPPANGVVTVDVAGRSDVPDDASAAIYNLTGVGADGPGFATSYPCDAARPLASNLNYGVGGVVANGSVTKLAANGTFCIYTLAAIDLIVDLVGYTVGVSHYVPIPPVRALDTREGWQRRCDWIVTTEADMQATPRAFVYNMSTGERRAVGLPGTMHRRGITIPPVIAPTCDALWVFVGWEADPSLQGLWRLGFDGSRTRTPPAPGIILGGGRGDLGMLADGRPALLLSHRLWDLANWADLGSVLPAEVRVEDRLHALVDSAISEDGSTVAAVYVHVSGARGSILVVADIDGTTVSTTTFTNDILSVGLSPDGTYVVVDELDATLGPITAFTTVLTRFGDVVDRVRGSDVTTMSEFVGLGALAVCVGGIGLFTVGLFGPVELVATEPDLRADGRGRCYGFGA